MPVLRIRTPSRLHFGLLSLPTADYWPNHQGSEVLPARRFGGVGLMVQSPGLVLAVRPSATWQANGPLAERALAFAGQVAEQIPGLGPHYVHVEEAAPEHVGLGTGTQLGLAIGRALLASAGMTELSVVELARLIGRGRRSGLGIHGFAEGGFLVDAGKGNANGIAPLMARLDFPEQWPVILILRESGQGLHGPAEVQAFRRLHAQGMPLAATDSLCRLVLLGLLPALRERDFQGFAEALYDFNARVGEVFRPEQGGVYAHAKVAEVVDFARRQGIRAVGQSSWGPTAFAIVEDADQARQVVQRLRERFHLRDGEVIVTTASNRGATCSEVNLASGGR